MSEPKKQPEKVEPTVGKAPEGEEIKSGKKEPVLGSAPANSNDEERVDGKKEPVLGELTAADVKIPEGSRKEPVVTAPISEISEERADGKIEPVVGDAPATEKPANDDDAEAQAPKAEEQPAAAAAAADENVIPPVAVAEDSAGAPPPNDNPPADAPAPKHHGRLAKVFNFVASMAAGAAVTAAAKTAAIVGMSVAGAPAWATLAVAGLAVGVGATLYHDLRERSAKKKEGETLSGYFSAAHGKELFSKKNAKVFGISTVAALIGSALMLGFHEGVIQDAWRGLIGGAPEVTPPVEQVIPPVEQVIPPVEEVIPPVEVTPPVEEVIAPVEEVVPAVVCLTPGEQFANLIQGHDVSGRVTDAIARSASTNAAVAAQGAKDLAFFAFNGFDGVPKDASVAVELFKQAADAGNLQAKVDLLYMQYHGLGGLTADPQAAVATMNSLPGARAAMFVEAWGGAGNAAGATFSTDSILKGMTVGCPTPG